MTEYRWKAGKKGRFKVTVICQQCSKSQNVCQCCVNDLTYGVPVAVRNSILAKHGAEQAWVKAGDVGAMARSGNAVGSGAIPDAAHAELMKMKARRDARGPDYSRNLPKFCTFDAKGENTRIDNPYRTGEKPAGFEQGGNIQQSIRDRFFGSAGGSSGGAQRTPGELTAAARAPLAPPAQADITTLWIGRLPDTAGEAELRQALSVHGAIARVHIKRDSGCAWVEFGTRAAAEAAAAATGTVLELPGSQFARVDWATPAAQRSGTGAGRTDRAAAAAAAAPAADGQPQEAAEWTDEQKAAYLKWHAEYMEWYAKHGGTAGAAPAGPTTSGPAPTGTGAGKNKGGREKASRTARQRESRPYYPSMDASTYGGHAE